MMMKPPKGLPGWHSRLARYAGVRRKFPGGGKAVAGMRLGLLWASAAAGFAGLLFGFDLVGDALAQGLTVVFEFGQERLESMYLKTFKLDLYQAQMATAYTGFMVFAGLAVFVFRKGSAACKEWRVIGQREVAKAQGLWMQHRANIVAWWDTLDRFNKASAAVGLIVLAIPVISLVLLALGNLAAEIM